MEKSLLFKGLGISCAISIPYLSTSKETARSVDRQELEKFSVVGHGVTEKWRQHQSNNTLINQGLMGEKEFKDAIINDSDSQRWVVKQEKGKSCWSTQKGQIIYCGYLEFANQDLEVDYKLQIKYQTPIREGEKGTGRINVVRKDNKTAELRHLVFQGYNQQGSGQKITNIKFENLLSFDQENGKSEWDNLLEISFKKDV